MKEFFDSVWRFLFGADPGSLFGAGDWSFRFIAEYSNYVRLSLGLVFAFMVWLTIRSYRREGEVSKGKKIALAALRISVLVLLFVIVMKPAIVWKRTRTLYSDVLVLIDDSNSMTLPNDVYDQQQTQELAELLKIDPAEVGGLTRLDIARQSLEGEDSVLLALAKDHNLKLLAFSTDNPQLEPYVRQLGALRLVGDGEEDFTASMPLSQDSVFQENRVVLTGVIRKARAMLENPQTRELLSQPLEDEQVRQEVVRNTRRTVQHYRLAGSDVADDLDRLVDDFEAGRINRLELTRRMLEIMEQGPEQLEFPPLEPAQAQQVAAAERRRFQSLPDEQAQVRRRGLELADSLEAGELTYVQYMRSLDDMQRDLLAEKMAKLTPAQRISLMLSSLDGKGFQTRYAQALGRALEMIRGRRTEAIIVIGDGQNTSESRAPSIDDVINEARRLSVPIIPVLVGSSRRPATVYVSSLRSNNRVPRNSGMTFTATVSYCNIEDDAGVLLRLLRRSQDEEGAEWTEVARTEKPVLLKRPSVEEYNKTLHVTEVEIPYEPKEVGRFEFKAEPVNDLSDPRARKVEPPSVLVRVLDERIRILLVGGDAGWEFQHLKNFLLRQPDLYQLSVWQQNADKDINQAASTGMKLESLPRTLEELVGSPGWTPEKQTENPDLHPGYNVVVLYDPYPTENGFDGHFADLLYQFVEQHGGGLCYIASNKNSAKVQALDEFQPLRALLPVELSFDVSSEVQRISGETGRAWKMRLTPYGQDHPIMMMEDSSEASLNAWAVLPGIYTSHHVKQRKPLARVLAVHGNPNRRSEDDLIEPLIVYQRFNLGRVLYMGTDETWRWQFVDAGYYYRRYWSNAMRFLATLRPKLVDILMVEGKERYDLDETVTFEVRAYDEKYKPLTDDTFTVILDPADPDEKEIQIPLEAVDKANAPGKYRGAFEPEREGTYTVTALSKEQRKDRVSEKRLIVTVPEAEKKQPQADEKRMHRLAGDGRALNITDIHELRNLPHGRREVPNDINKELWDTPLMLLIIALLLCTEWILRKKYNMA
jgi:hypothetical protein